MDFFKIEMPRGADCARVDGRRDSRRTPGRARIAGRSIDGLTDDDDGTDESRRRGGCWAHRSTRRRRDETGRRVTMRNLGERKRIAMVIIDAERPGRGVDTR